MLSLTIQAITSSSIQSSAWLNVGIMMSTIANNGNSFSDELNLRTVLLQNHLNRLQSSPNETLLLDGGTGEELFRRGVPDDRKIWSATAIVNEQYHSVVEDVHKSFLLAGSQAITTNSYGITPGVGFTDGEEVKRLVGISGKIARRAVNMPSSTNPSALVIGSLGPLVESYRPDLIMNHDAGVAAYQYAVHGLYPHVDVYLGETMSCVEEACQVIDAISIFYRGLHDPTLNKHPLLVSFSLNQDGNLRDGETVVNAIPKVTEFARQKQVNLIGALFNCCEPESISKAINKIRQDQTIQQYLQHPTLKSSSDIILNMDAPHKLLLGAYANRLTPVDPDWTLESSEGAQAMRDDLSPDKYSREFVNLWRSRNQVGGVQLIGGCCGIGADHISVLNELLDHE